MGFQVAAVAPSPCARSSSVSSSPSTSSRPLPALLGGGCAGLARSRGVMVWRPRPARTTARSALSASLDGMGAGDAEFLRRIEELAAAAGVQPAGAAGCGWPASVERSASSVGLPLSLRMLKRKKKQQQQRQVVARQSRWDEGLLGSAGESVGRAFSSMVLIVRELQSFALQQMRDALLCDDLQGVLARVQGEMHASFVWLFQHIFAGTPALMLSLMLLLANFTVHSMGHSVAAAAATIPPAPPAVAAAAAVVDNQRAEPSRPRFDKVSVKTFSVGRTASVGGNSGGGGKAPPVAGATGDGWSDESLYRLSRVAPQQPSTPAGAGLGEAAPDASDEDEQAIWEMMVTEASKMQASARAEELSDPDVLGSLVAPVEAELETEDQAEHVRTRQRYEQAVADEPNNSLILANFAQFLYLVQNDHDRAEHYFELAVRAEPADAEALSRYATFLWKARDNLAGAEDTYQEAIAADPGNAHHAAAYAHFLWNTGACAGAATRRDG
ncbi:hypothetical protein SEVIR_3G228200v4 [Setaria viridis]|uniref:Uncharacterized protein n=1 Tax=Setaria viridis TaxID=4556 RepID=A0A4U6VCH4_SETVI|nr:uncharacterized protein LOC117849914 [Setaria viridis]TKW26998.1 hypothetical protein SEVIR_3G228200v2 [Setaria viridis]